MYVAGAVMDLFEDNIEVFNISVLEWFSLMASSHLHLMYTQKYDHLK